jgi:hypothetical protein
MGCASGGVVLLNDDHTSVAGLVPDRLEPMHCGLIGVGFAALLTNLAHRGGPALRNNSVRTESSVRDATRSPLRAS